MRLFVKSPDRMAVARMGERYAMVQAFTGESALLEKAIESLKPVDRATGLFEGVYKGSDALWSHPAPPHRKMLLLFSDGGNDKAGFSQEQAEQRARERFVDVHVLHYSGGRRKLRKSARAGCTTLCPAKQQATALQRRGGTYDHPAQ